MNSLSSDNTAGAKRKAFHKLAAGFQFDAQFLKQTYGSCWENAANPISSTSQ